jgi:threonine aldolase
MRRAMAEAEVGDDVFGDDPTVNRLEAAAAERLGQEAALIVPSGTMANLVAVMTHTRPGDEILLGSEAHIFHFEVAGAARIAHVQTHPLPNDPADGSLSARDVVESVRPANIHAPRTTLLCLENTHNRCGGRAMSRETTQALIGTAARHGLRVHIDGARIFNAEVASGCLAAELTAGADSVSFCLSKGLGCPAGSLICGSKDFVAEARRNRKLLGGGMRQAGILAAAGLFALEHNISRLAEDHANAAWLAEGLSALEVFEPEPVQTNIVAVNLRHGSSDTWGRALRQAGVLCTAFGPSRLRFVTHLDVSRADIDSALGRIEKAAEAVAV